MKLAIFDEAMAENRPPVPFTETGYLLHFVDRPASRPRAVRQLTLFFGKPTTAALRSKRLNS